jgi:hypothetical protein
MSFINLQDNSFIPSGFQQGTLQNNQSYSLVASLAWMRPELQFATAKLVPVKLILLLERWRSRLE